MFEWDEAKREWTLEDRGLDFADARPLFDGRPVVEFPAKTPTEARTLTVGQLGDGKFYTVVLELARRGPADHLLQEGTR